MDNIKAFKMGYRDAKRVAKVATPAGDLSRNEVLALRPSLYNFTEAYRNGWTDAVTGDDWRIKYLATI